MADWQLSPLKERELAEDRRQERGRRWNVALLVVAVIGVCPMGCLGACLSGATAGGGWAAGISIGSVVLLVAAIVRYANGSEIARRRRLVRRQEFGEVAGWIVEMTIHQGEALSGRDVGVVWFEEDRLYFTGVRTSFGLGPGDVAARIAGRHEVLDTGSHLTLPLDAPSSVGTVAIGLRFISPEPESYTVATSETAFRQALRAWITSGKTRGQLPPLAMGPDMPSVMALQRRAALASAVGPGFVLLLVLSSTFKGFMPALVVLALVLLVALWPPALLPRRCWRAVNDRRRLDGALRHNREQ